MPDINPRFSLHQEYRQAVGELCSQFGSSYWQDVEGRAGAERILIADLILSYIGEHVLGMPRSF